MLTGVAGATSVDAGVPYALGLTSAQSAPLKYRVVWGAAGEGTTDVVGTATSIPAHTYAQAGTYRPVIEALDANDQPIGGTDTPLAFDPTFGDRGRVSTLFSRAGAAAPTSNAGYSVVQQPDGKLLVGGTSYRSDGGSDYLLARYRADGSLDTAFGSAGRVAASFYSASETAGSSEVYKVVLQRNGKILLVGAAANAQSRGKDLAAVRYNPDGSLDATFGADGVLRLDLSVGTADSDDVAYDATVQADGKILLAGSTKAGSAAGDFAVVRLSTYGDLDPTFGQGGIQRIDLSGGDDVARGIAVSEGGKVLVGGQADTSFGLARLLADGQLDTTFDGDAHGAGKVVVALPGGTEVEVHSMAVQGNGKIVLAGRAINGESNYGLARFNADGTLDVSLNAGGAIDGGTAGTLSLDLLSDQESAFAVAIQPADGKIVLAGQVSKDGTLQGVLVRLNADGTPDANFGIEGQLTPAVGDVLALGVQADGKILGASSQGDHAVLIRLQPTNTVTVTAATRTGVAVTPHAGTVLGQVQEHAAVVLDLNPGASSGGAPSGWEVNWGDGQVQTYTGSPATAVHVYTGAPNSYVVVATALDGIGIVTVRHPAAPVVVTVGLDRPLAGDVTILDDGAPAGATEGEFGGTFTWQSSSPTTPFSGSTSLASDVSSGLRHHWVEGLPSPTAVNVGDVVYAYVWLDPANPPEMVGLRWKDSTGSWLHGAYWGRESAAATMGMTEGTAEWFSMGRLPATGGWARLEVPAAAVGLEGKSVAGIDFVVTGGRAAFDRTGVNRKPAGPGMPTGVVAFAQTGTQVRLEWQDVAGETKYKIMRSTDGVNFAGVGVVTGGSTSFTDTHVAPGTRYWYRVDAYNGTAFTRSAVASATTPVRTTDLSHGLWARYFDNETTTAPAVAQLEQSLDLNWGDASPVPTIRSDHFSAELTGRITPVHGSGSGTYTFWVRANSGVRLWVDGQLLIDQAADTPFPGDANRDGTVDFTDLLALSRNYNQSGKTWEEGDFDGNGLVNFNDLLILASHNNMVETPFEYPASGAGSANTIQLVAGQSYDIRLQVTDSYGFGSARLLWQTPLSGATRQDVPLAQLTPGLPPVPAAPLPPTDLAVAVGGPRQVTLSWSDQSAGEQGFRIERRVGNSRRWRFLANVGAGQEAFTDIGLLPNTVYAYRVASNNAAGQSPFAAAEAVTTAVDTSDTVPPIAIASPRAAFPDADSIELHWAAATDAVGVLGYEVYRDGILLDTTSGTSFLDRPIDAGVTYSYAIVAYDAAGNRSASVALTARHPVANSSAAAGDPVTIDGPDSVGEGTRVTLRGWLNGAVAGTALTYVWSITRTKEVGGAALGDPVTGSGQTFAFTPPDDGVYEVKLQIRDATRNVFTGYRTIVATNAPPTVRITGRTAGAVGRTMIFVSEVTDPAGKLDLTLPGATYAWSVDQEYSPEDGLGGWTSYSLPVGTVTNRPSFAFVLPSPDSQNTFGRFRVRLTVTDDDGGVSAEAGRSFTVVDGQTEVTPVDSFELTIPDDETDGSSPDPAAESMGQVVAVQPDGKLLVGGTAKLSGTYYFTLARFTATGDGYEPDKSFGDLVDGAAGVAGERKGYVLTKVPRATELGRQGAQGIALDSNGRIVLVGESAETDANGNPLTSSDRFAVLRYTANGTIDTSFDSQASGNDPAHNGMVFEKIGLSSGARAVVVRPEGTILVGGWARVESGASVPPQFAVMSLTDNGGLDPSFDSTNAEHTNGDGIVTTRISPTEITDVGHHPSPSLMSAPDATATIRAMVLQSGGDLVVGGYATVVADQASDFILVRYDSYGLRDSTFGEDPTADGVVSTDFDRKWVNPENPEFVQHFNEDFITSLALGPGGEILAAGWAGVANPNTDADLSDVAFARYDKDGKPDATFGTLDGNVRTGRVTWDVSDTDGEAVTGIALQRDGRIVAAVSGDMHGHAYLVRLNTDGSSDTGLPGDTTSGDAFGDNNVFRPGTTALTGMEVPGGVVITPDGIAAAGYNGDPAGDMVVGLYRREDAGAVNLRAAAANDGTIGLTWNAAANGGDGYEILRSTHEADLAGDNPAASGDVTSDFVDVETTTFVDRDAVPGTRYYYRVFGLLGGTRKGGSNVASAVAVTPNTKYVWQETVWVPVTGEPEPSKTTLLKDHDYQLRTSGEFALSPENYGPQYRADSEYGLYRPRPYDVRPDGTGVDYGLDIVDNTEVQGQSAPNDHPFWGAPSDSADHGYTIGYRGNGGTLTFRYRDDYYGDNQTGYLMKVEVYKAVPSTPTSLSATAHRDPLHPSITLTWKDAPADATYLSLQRWVDGVADAQPRVLAAGDTSYVDTDVVANTIYSYRLVAHGPDGDSDPSNEAVALVANDPPSIGAIPDQTVTRGEWFELQVPASDDGDGTFGPGGTTEGLTYDLIETPDDDMKVSSNGLISWHPQDPAYDGQTYVVGVKVGDGGAWSVRQFALTIQAAAPAFDVTVTASPTTVTDTDLNLEATPIGDVPAGGISDYTWAMLAKPRGVDDPTFEHADERQTKVTFAAPGVYSFQVTAKAADNTSRVSRPVTVTVVQTAHSVVLTREAETVARDESAILRASVLDQFGRPFTALEYDNTSFFWTAGQDPLDAADITPDHVAYHSATATEVTITAHYAQGGVSLDGSTTVTVSPLDPPAISSTSVTPPATNADQKVWSASVVADDPGSGGEAVLKYTWRVVDGPAGAPAPTFSPNETHGASTTNVRVWTAGNYVLEVRVYNPQTGLSAKAQVALNTAAVLTTIGIAQNAKRVDYGSALQLSLVGFDQFGQPMSAAALSGAAWTLDKGVGGINGSTGLYTAPPTAPTTNEDEQTAIVSAVVNGLSATASLRVSKPVAPTVHLRPLIDGRGTALTVLDRDAQVQADVTGRADADVPYTLTAQPVDGNGGKAIVIRQGVLRPSEGLGTPIDIGTLSPTLLADGAYDLTLTVGSNNVTGEDKRRFEVRTELRLGNLTLPSTDVTLNTSGMPITVSRIYDTLRAGRSDRFGAGWRSELDDVDLRITTGPGVADSRYATNYPSLHAGDVLYVTLPGGRQEAFMFDPEGLEQGGHTQSGLYLTFAPRFDTLNGTGSTFVADQETVGTTSKPYYLRQFGGEYFADATGVGYNPANSAFGGGFTIKTRDGTAYTIATAMTTSGLVGRITSIVDKSGDKIEIKDNHDGTRTIQHSRGTVSDLAVTYKLDSAGRVTKVVDPNQAKVFYAYDAPSGTLVGVLDRLKRPTTYLYNDLLQTTRPVGDAQDVYAIVQRDSDGYAWQQVNGTWQFAVYNPQTLANCKIDLAAAEVDGDAATIVGDRWRASSIPGATGIPTGTKLRITYRLHTGTTYASTDAQAGSTETRDWLGRPGYMTGVVDPRGVTILSATYDPASGQLTALSDVHKKSAPVGGQGFNGDSASRTVTDLAGNQTEMVYDKRGSVVREIAQVKDATGRLTGYSVTVHEYNYNVDNGGLSWAKDGQPFFVAVTAPLTARYANPVSPVWQTITDYDTDGKVYKVTAPNPAGSNAPPLVTTMGSFTDLGQPQTVTDAYGQLTRTKYDDAGHVLWTTNPLGEGTEYTYTSTGQPYQTFRVFDTDHNPATPPDRLDVDAGKPTSTNEYYTVDDVGEPDKVLGMLKTSTDFGGVSTRYTYYLDGNVKDVYHEWTTTDANNVEHDHSVLESHTDYDDEGRAIATTDAFGHTTRTVYDVLGQAAESIDAHGNYTYSTYDAAGRLIETRETHVLAATIAPFADNADGSIHVETTTPHGLVSGDTVTLVPASGDPSTWTISVTGAAEFDLLGSTSATPRPLLADLRVDVTDAVTRTAYDAMGRAEWTVDRYKPTGDATTDAGANGTHTLYDSQGRAWKTERVADVVIAIEPDPDPAVAGAGLLRAKLRSTGAVLSTTKTTFDGAGRIATQTGPDGQPTSYAYNADGSTQKVTDALRHETTYTPSGPVNATEATLPGHPIRKNAVTDALNQTTTTYYDALGRVVRTTYQDGTFTQTLYGVANQHVDQHDVAGQTITGQQVTKIDQLQNATDYFYDQQGRLTDVWLPAVDDATTPSDPTLIRPHWHYGYDDNGNQISQELANTGQTTTFVYGQPGDVTDDRYYATRTARILPGDTTTRHEREADTYDTFGRPKIHTDFKGNVTQFIYDDRDPASPVPAAEQRNAGRLVYKRYYDPAGVLKETVHYTYDALGQTTNVTDNTGTTTYAYDADGRTTTVASPQGTIHYEYDLATGRHTATWTGAGPRAAATTDTLYGYDELGRLKSVTSAKINGAAPTGQATTFYAYDAAGNLDTVSLPNGIVTDYDYDDLNRLTLETIKRPGGTTEQTYAYTLLDDGQRDHVIETRYNADGTTFSTTKIGWAYDALGRLKQEKRDEGGDSVQNGGDYTADYKYDLAGNRHAKDFDSADNSKDESIGYTFNADDQLTGEDSSINANDVTYTYDLNGSQETKTQAGQTTRYTWDVQNRLTAVDANDDGDLTDPHDAAYAYDADGVRIRKTVGGVATTYVNDPLNPTGYSKPVEEHDAAGNVLVSYVLGHDILAQTKATDGQSPKYLLKDGHGTTRILAEADATVVERYDFDAFGTAIDFDPMTAGTAHFAPDGPTDVCTSFIYSLARYRDEFQFVSRDDYEGFAASPITLHTYLYAEGDAANRLDPSGHMSSGEILTVTTIGGALMGMLAGGAAAAYKGYKITEPRFWGWTLGGALAGAAIGYVGGVVLIRLGLVAVTAGGSAAPPIAQRIAPTVEQAAERGYESHKQMLTAWTEQLGAWSSDLRLHHLVEQARDFPQRALQSFSNTVPIPDVLHRAITSFYQSGPRSLQFMQDNEDMRSFTTLRQWMNTQSWETSWRWGVAVYQYVIRNGSMSGFNPNDFGL